MDSYNFESKHLYRARREAAIDRLAPGNPKTRRVAYLDTAEALDTIAYLRRGYQPQNLWAINRSGAEVAHLTMKLRKLGLPDVNTVGLDFEKALSQRVPEVDVVDFDGMGAVSPKLAEMLKRIMESRLGAVYGVTIVGGREASNNPFRKLTPFSEICKTSFNELTNPNHARRLTILLAEIRGYQVGSCWIHFDRILWDCYLSQGHPMVWAVVKTTPHHPVNGKEILRTLGSSSLLPIFTCLCGRLNRPEGLDRRAFELLLERSEQDRSYSNQLYEVHGAELQARRQKRAEAIKEAEEFLKTPRIFRYDPKTERAEQKLRDLLARVNEENG